LVREFSAGGVVLRKMRGRWFIAVIEPHVERRKKVPTKTAGKTKEPPVVRALPKGAIDEGEKPEQTALREVEEETGVRAQMIGKLADVKYVYVRNWGDKARVFKIVSFYLLLYRAGKLDHIAPEMRVEVQRAFWMPLEEAPNKLSYKGEREMTERALEYVAAHPDLEGSGTPNES
jgi:8-oxo-dGTP pyrophosphatase MutT (NUDIX family)